MTDVFHPAELEAQTMYILNDDGSWDTASPSDYHAFTYVDEAHTLNIPASLYTYGNSTYYDNGLTHYVNLPYYRDLRYSFDGFLVYDVELA